MRKVQVGDIVKVIQGNARGTRGEVMSLDPDTERIVVKNAITITKHQRPTQQQRQGGIIEREGSLPLSNVLVICPACDRPTRVGFQVLGSGEKLRQCRKCEETFE